MQNEPSAHGVGSGSHVNSLAIFCLFFSSWHPGNRALRASLVVFYPTVCSRSPFIDGHDGYPVCTLFLGPPGPRSPCKLIYNRSFNRSLSRCASTGSLALFWSSSPSYEILLAPFIPLYSQPVFFFSRIVSFVNVAAVIRSLQPVLRKYTISVLVVHTLRDDIALYYSVFAGLQAFSPCYGPAPY